MKWPHPKGLTQVRSRSRVQRFKSSLQNGWHPHKFKRANKALRRLKTYLGRTIRDIGRQITGDARLDAIFKWPLYQAATIIEQRQRQRGRKIYSLHAHKVECIGKGKVHMPFNAEKMTLEGMEAGLAVAKPGATAEDIAIAFFLFIFSDRYFELQSCCDAIGFSHVCIKNAPWMK